MFDVWMIGVDDCIGRSGMIIIFDDEMLMVYVDGEFDLFVVKCVECVILVDFVFV